MKMLAAAIAAITLGTASPALAATTIANVTITGQWFQTVGSGNPFGLLDQPTLSATITFDSETANPFAAINYVTGTKTWTAADIDLNQSWVTFNPTGGATGFRIGFIGTNNSIGGGSAQVFDGTAAIACNGCVTVTGLAKAAVPEPATWALMITGFGLAGVGIRHQRRNTLPA